MRFLVDAQLSPALVDRLKSAGNEAAHVNDIGLGETGDERIWNHAVDHNMVINTKDQDFADLALRHSDGPSVVWIRLGNTRTQALWSSLEPLLPEILDGLDRGERLIEIT